MFNSTDVGTAGREIAPTPAFPQTQAPTISQLTEKAGFLYNQATILHEDTDEIHLELLMTEWKSKTAEFVRQNMVTLLTKLGELGFAWRDIARLVGVSIPAVQKWRKGGPFAGENRTNVAAVLATCELLSQHYLIQDVASWFESPIIIDYPITPLDLYSAKAIHLVFQLSSGKADPEQILTAFDPNWRKSYRREFEVFRIDGQLALRPREH